MPGPVYRWGRFRVATAVRKLTRVLGILGGLVLVAAGCVPPPTAAATDTLDLGALGAFSEPSLDVTATATFDYNPRGPRTTLLEVVARDDEGDVVRSFTMREDNVSGEVTEAGVGEFPGVLAPPHTRQFTIDGAGDADATTVFGAVTITELTTGEFHDALNGGTYDLTRLRASFHGVFDGQGVVEGYLTIG